jgi:hypothetical protein
MFQFLSGGQGGDENSLVGGFVGFDWAFETVFDELGGYLVESNQGHFADEGTTGLSDEVELFGASAETGIYSKSVAEEMYGSAPHHSYVWGGSGGGLRSLCCIENRPDVWEGDVSFVIGDVSASASSWTVMYWWLYCRDKRADIIDATEPGGSGDPFATLDHDQRHALATLYRGGWNRGAENQLWASAAWLYALPNMMDNDATYLDEFWTSAGYLGHDHPERLTAVLVDQRCQVTSVRAGDDGPGQLWLPLPPSEGASPDQPAKGRSYGIEVDADLGADPNRLFMAKVTVLTGQAKGRQVFVAREGDVLLGERMTAPDMFDGVEAGDEVRIDNRDQIAWAHLWMYSIDLDNWAAEDRATGERRLAPEYAGLGVVMVDGRPIYPQRPGPVRPTVMTGRFDRKVIHVSCTHDTIVSVPSVGAYHRKVRDYHGDETDAFYRLWWVENAPHASPEWFLPAVLPDKDPGLWRSRLVDYDGAIQEALRRIVPWVEDGTPPPKTTSYRYTGDSGLVLADVAAERGGVQPVVRAEANGGVRTEVKVGEPVTFTGLAEQPPGTGTIVSARWDFLGDGSFAHEQALEDGMSSIKVEATHGYAEPGTYFASFRVGARRGGIKSRGLPIENGARVRVVVTA